MWDAEQRGGYACAQAWSGRLPALSGAVDACLYWQLSSLIRVSRYKMLVGETPSLERSGLVAGQGGDEAGLGCTTSGWLETDRLRRLPGCAEVVGVKRALVKGREGH